MLTSGKTPLLRMRAMEEKLGVGEIYLKLEGLNPTGHKVSRIAEILVKDAKSHDYKKILAHGSNAFIDAIIHYAELEEIDVLVPLFKNERRKGRYKERLVDRRKDNCKAYKSFLDLAQEYDAYLAAEGINNTHISQMILEDLTEELMERAGYDVDTIYLQFSHGYTLTSMYNSFLKSWIDGNVKRFPKLICGTRSSGAPEELDFFHQVANQNEELLREATNALKETDGEIVQVTKEAIRESTRLLRRLEKITFSTEEAYGFAAFYMHAKAGKIKPGKHVIIMNDAKSVVRIEDIKNSKKFSREEIVEFTRRWLADYKDSTKETSDAIDNAMRDGFILLAERDGDYQGICVVVNLGFKDFIPTYHIAYIGTEKESKGRGIGTELITRVVDITGGNVSLHVDMDNRAAKKLYEKMGFKHFYNRMIYDG